MQKIRTHCLSWCSPGWPVVDFRGLFRTRALLICIMCFQWRTPDILSPSPHCSFPPFICRSSVSEVQKRKADAPSVPRDGRATGGPIWRAQSAGMNTALFTSAARHQRRDRLVMGHRRQQPPLERPGRPDNEENLGQPSAMKYARIPTGEPPEGKQASG